MYIEILYDFLNITMCCLKWLQWGDNFFNQKHLQKIKRTYIMKVGKSKKEGSDFYENKNYRKRTKDNRSNKRLC